MLFFFLVQGGFLLIAPGWNGSVLHAQLAPAGAKLNVPAEAMKRRCVKMVTPAYPSGANRPGSVVVRVVITAGGSVSPVSVVSGDAVFAQAAMDVVKSWGYNPYLAGGIPTAVSTEVTVDFVPGTPAGVVSHPHPKESLDESPR